MNEQNNIEKQLRLPEKVWPPQMVRPISLAVAKRAKHISILTYYHNNPSLCCSECKMCLQLKTFRRTDDGFKEMLKSYSCLLYICPGEYGQFDCYSAASLKTVGWWTGTRFEVTFSLLSGQGAQETHTHTVSQWSVTMALNTQLRGAGSPTMINTLRQTV